MTNHEYVPALFNAYQQAVKQARIGTRFREFQMFLQGAIPESGQISILMNAVSRGIYQPGEGWKSPAIEGAFLHALEKRRKKRQ